MSSNHRHTVVADIDSLAAGIDTSYMSLLLCFLVQWSDTTLSSGRGYRWGPWEKVAAISQLPSWTSASSPLAATTVSDLPPLVDPVRSQTLCCLFLSTCFLITLYLINHGNIALVYTIFNIIRVSIARYVSYFCPFYLSQQWIVASQLGHLSADEEDLLIFVKVLLLFLLTGTRRYYVRF